MDFTTITVDMRPLGMNTTYKVPEYEINMNFAFVTADNRLVETPSSCKDYLQNLLWAENIGKPDSIGFGRWQPGVFDIKTPTLKLLIYKTKCVFSDENVEGLQKLLNIYDKAQGFSPSIIYKTQFSSAIVIEFDSGWAFSGPMISAFTSIIRIGELYTNEAPLDYFRWMYSKSGYFMDKSEYLYRESTRLDKTFKKLAALLLGKRPEAKWEDTHDYGSTHCYGIIGCDKFPKENVELYIETLKPGI